MPTWSGVLNELNQSAVDGQPPQLDLVRRKYLLSAHVKTQRDVILYMTKWTQGGPVQPDLVSISEEDIQGLMEVVHGLKGPFLDLIIHSPGGSLEAAEAFVTYLRSKFSHIRVVVPNMAMSAASMVACAADVVLLGKHSFLGPTDPQIVLNTPLGIRMVPAQAILAQFEMAKKECRDPAKMGAWLPMLTQYGPDILVQCENASDRARDLVKKWLNEYMFKNEPDGEQKSESIADWLSTHDNFKSHARHIPRTELEEKGINIERLEDDQELQDIFLSIFHATTFTFTASPVVKIIENHLGMAFMRNAQTIPSISSR